MNTLEIKNLHVNVGGKEILKGISLVIRQGEIHALMGPNGSGKSTLSYAIMGHPKYVITGGEIKFNGKDITKLGPDERARLGLFLSFQYPMEIQGVRMNNFIRIALKSSDEQAAENVADFKRDLDQKMTELKMDGSFASRYVNDGFSGGEKKRAEILQMTMLRPKIAILDEVDSGLDIDALGVVAGGISKTVSENGTGMLVITHYQRILDFIKPDYVHVVLDGKIVKSGGHDLVKRLEQEGYSWTNSDAGD